MDTTNPRNRNFMLLIFANLVRKFSNTRTSTYKLHQKRDNEISNLSSNILDTFIKQARKATEHFTFSTSDYQLYKANTLDVMPVLDDESVDIILTSPPYGDNQTTVPYGQFSSLALYWLQGTGAEFEGWELESYNVIDSSSMGGRKKHYNFNELQNEIIDIRTRGVSNNKINKVLNFLHDYFKFLDEATRISKEYIILTLGNRTVDGIRISLTEITKDYLSCKPFNLVKQFERELQNKRIPDYVSNVDNRPVQSMKKEYVLVFKK